MKKAIVSLIGCFILMVWTMVSLSMDSSRTNTIGAIEIFVAIAIVAGLSVRTIIKKSRVKEAPNANKHDPTTPAKHS